MLYVSTRDKADTNTSYKTICLDHPQDGGMFVPLCVPELCTEEMTALLSKESSQIIARILNLFFSQHLSAEDVGSWIGENPFKLRVLSQRTVAGELWHNDSGDYEQFVCSLYGKLCRGLDRPVSGWSKIAIEIAVLFALFGELADKGIADADIVMASGDFTYPMAAWYARRMGLPIGSIICACNENDTAWEFINHGRLTTGDAGVERLVYELLGQEEVRRSLKDCADLGAYQLSEEQLPVLDEAMRASIVGEGRIDTVISSVFQTNNYIIDPVTAVSFGALQDHRALTGENRNTLLLSRENPLAYVPRISVATGCSKEKLKSMIRISGE